MSNPLETEKLKEEPIASFRKMQMSLIIAGNDNIEFN